jgi:MFS family permease
MLRHALPASLEARRILVGTMFSSVGRGLTLPFLLIYLTQVRGFNAGTVGLLIGWMGVVALVLAPIGGTLVDRFGARAVALPLFGIAAVSTGSLAFVHNIQSAFISLTAVAVAFSGLWSGQNTILATLVSEEERQRTFGLQFTLLNLGIGVGGVISGSIVDPTRIGTFQAIYYADAVSYLIPGIILLTMPRVGRRTERAPAHTEVEVKPRGGYRLVLRDRSFVRFFIFGLALTTFGYAQIEVGFTAFATQVAGVADAAIGWAFAANTLVIVLAQLFVLRWLEGRSRTRALALVGLIFAASWSVLGLAGLAGSSGSAALAVAAVIGTFVIFAVGETLLSPIMPSITNALATDDLRGRYNAMASMVWGVSGIIGPVAAGPLIGSGHARVWILMVIGGCLLAFGLALDLHRRLTPVQDGRTPAGTPRPATAVETAVVAS